MIQNELQEWIMLAKQNESFRQVGSLPIIAASDIVLRLENQDRIAVLIMDSLMLPTEHIKTELGQMWSTSGTIQLTKDGVR